MFLPIVLVSAICLYLSFWWKRRRMVELSKDVPSWSTCLPLLGHAHRFIGDNAIPIFRLHHQTLTIKEHFKTVPTSPNMAGIPFTITEFQCQQFGFVITP
ncbi:hypothetical protein EVAR_23923_1 [Eumeta japonica]|uniref:Uncharacterized protein n=1 Tax=Eumeta variegata TaxID=151549 RepID=A0A4C1V347_EUMVA|nr:hypothetical protein EVAR_23923_1 [Eumeta japonica]